MLSEDGEDQSSHCHPAMKFTGWLLPLTFSPVVSDSRAQCSSPFPSRRASVCPKTVSVVTWPARLDTKRCYLPTEVVPIYLLAFLHAFELLGWQELGQSDGSSVTWIQSYDCWSSELAAQRLLWFYPQRHHVHVSCLHKHKIKWST